MAPKSEAVTVTLEDLKNGTVASETLREAFGPDSLGILLVKDVPAEFAELRRRVLSYSSYLGNLPEEALVKLERAAAKYLTGWACGKERLKNGEADRLKGSFYANCAFYVDPTLECAVPSEAFSPATFPEYLSPNVWPDGPATGLLPGFRAAFEALCRLIIDVAVLVARACDRFAMQADSGIADYPGPAYLETVVRTSTSTKARLLHYYPQEAVEADAASSADNDDSDDWCATHLDHGCLTGLTSAMFVDEGEPETAQALAAATAAPDGAASASVTLPRLSELAASPDAAAGLYIVSRTGQTVQVKIPRDCIAFQTGETLERITNGQFKAVPHFVRGPRASSTGSTGSTGSAARGHAASRRIARNTLAVFTQPNLDEVVDRAQNITFGEFARGVVAKNTVQA